MYVWQAVYHTWPRSFTTQSQPSCVRYSPAKMAAKSAVQCSFAHTPRFAAIVMHAVEQITNRNIAYSQWFPNCLQPMQSKLISPIETLPTGSGFPTAWNRHGNYNEGITNYPGILQHRHMGTESLAEVSLLLSCNELTLNVHGNGGKVRRQTQRTCKTKYKCGPL